MATAKQAAPLYTVLGVQDQQMYDDEHRPIAGRRVLYQMIDGAKFFEDFPVDTFSMETVGAALDERAKQFAQVMSLEGAHVTLDEQGRPQPVQSSAS